MEKTLGEKRVRVEFNPNNNGSVDKIKQKAAELINVIRELEVVKEGVVDKSEAYRLQALALTAIEEGAMWAVKYATS